MRAGKKLHEKELLAELVSTGRRGTRLGQPGFIKMPHNPHRPSSSKVIFIKNTLS
jgi:hypothetical protein